jgi:hypothetical protein
MLEAHPTAEPSQKRLCFSIFVTCPYLKASVMAAAYFFSKVKYLFRFNSDDLCLWGDLFEIECHGGG